MKTITRKEFLKNFSLSTLALLMPEINLAKLNLPKIGLQLYTVRRQLEKNFKDTIKKISYVGFYGVETYDVPSYITLENAAKIIKSFNLEVLAMHTALPIEMEREHVIKMADIYNSKIVVFHGWPEDNKYNKDNINKTIDTYNEISHYLQSQGLTFALHNHWWEFEKIDDFYPFYYLLENLDKEIIFELDTYWIKTAKLDPVKVVSDFGYRAPLIHIKDGPASKGENIYKQVPAGKGSINFPEIINNNIESIKWLIVEFDEYDKNILEGIKESYDYLCKNKLGKGKIEVTK